jgi:hypothetical protein
MKKHFGFFGVKSALWLPRVLSQVVRLQGPFGERWNSCRSQLGTTRTEVVRADVCN